MTDQDKSREIAEDVIAGAKVNRLFEVSAANAIVETEKGKDVTGPCAVFNTVQDMKFQTILGAVGKLQDMGVPKEKAIPVALGAYMNAEQAVDEALTKIEPPVDFSVLEKADRACAAQPKSKPLPPQKGPTKSL